MQALHAALCSWGIRVSQSDYLLRQYEVPGKIFISYRREQRSANLDNARQLLRAADA